MGACLVSQPFERLVLSPIGIGQAILLATLGDFNLGLMPC
jgi:hypothetical protein